MPNIPGTSIPWPFGWFSDPASGQPEIDSSQAQSVVNQLAADHGGVVGQPQANITDAKGKPTDISRYSFGDGSSLQISPSGVIDDWTPKGTGARTGWTDFQQIRNADQSITYYGKDPADGKLKPVPDLPNSAAPESVKTTPTPSAQLDKLDAKGNVIAPDDTTTKPVSLRDPKTGTVIDIPKDASGSLTTINKTPYLVKPDGTATVVTGPDGKPLSVNDKSTVNVPGKGLVEYDPSKSGDDAYHVVPGTEPSTNRLAKDLQPVVRNGKTYIAVDSAGGIVWQEAKDDQGNALPTETTYTVAQNDPRSPNVLLIDSQGNSKLVSKGPDWKPPPVAAAGQALTPDTTSPFVVTIGDNGQPVFTKNQNALSISDAQKQLIQQLGGKVADGTMSEKAAQDLITNLTQAMTAQASATNAQANMVNAQANVAQNAIQGVNQAAQVGQGLLQNRVTAATGALNNAISAIGGSKMTSAPAGMGANLVNGLSEWVTQLGGGQPVYDAAAAMVNQANPTISQNPTVAQQAYSTLRGMMDLYKQQTGQDYQPPAVRQQQQQQPSFTSPTTLADGTPQSSVTPSAPQLANRTAAAQQLQQATAPQNAPFGAIAPNPMLAAQQMANRNLASQQTAAATAQTGLPFGPQPLQPIPIPPLPFQAPVTA